jgi:hypothetical protein
VVQFLGSTICFLGYFRVLRSIPVAVLTGESGLPTIKDTLARIARAAMIDPAAVTRLVISDRIPHLSNPAHLDAIRRLILCYELELLAVDPAYLALDGTDANNVMVFGAQLRAVSELCQDMGVALLLCHHTRKGAGADGQPIQLTDASWSGFAEHARQWLLVNNRERYDHETGTHRLWLSGGGSAGHGGLWAVDVHQGRLSDAGGRVWEASVSTPNEAHNAVADRREQDRAAKAQATLERDAKKVLDVLAGAAAAVAKERATNPPRRGRKKKGAVALPDGATKNTIRDRAGLSGLRVNAAVAWLLGEERIVETMLQVSNHKTPQPGYKLAEPKDET